MSETSQKKILIVDDEVHIVKALEFLFSDAGYDIQTAHDGHTALQKALEFMPNVLLLDVMMPGMDGFTVAKTIRQNENLTDTYIIFLTAKGASSDKMTGYDSGAEYYIVKPFDNDDILEKVTDILNTQY